jgi:hypothetical protein
MAEAWKQIPERFKAVKNNVLEPDYSKTVMAVMTNF